MLLLMILMLQFLKSIRFMKHLAASKTLCFRLVIFNFLHTNRFKSPGVVN